MLDFLPAVSIQPAVGGTNPRNDSDQTKEKDKVMSIKCGKYLAAVAVASLAGVCAQAQVVGQLWKVSEGVAEDATIANYNTVSASTPDVTFNVANGSLNFSAGGNNYTPDHFITSGGGTVISDDGFGSQAMGVFNGNSQDYGTLISFSGQVTLTAGEQFTVGHDDGLTLVIGGQTVVNVPGPTALTDTSYTWGGAAGTFNFQLVYGECNGAPADLIVDLPLQFNTVPDTGSTLAMLGGTLTLVGTVSRRFRK